MTDLITVNIARLEYPDLASKLNNYLYISKRLTPVKVGSGRFIRRSELDALRQHFAAKKQYGARALQLREEGKSLSEIAAIFKAEGHEITPSAVSRSITRYLAKQKPKRKTSKKASAK